MIEVIKYFRRSYFFGSTTLKTFCGEKWRQIQLIHNCFKFWSSRHCCNKLYTSLQILDIIWQVKIQFYKIESMLHIFWCATNFPIFSIIKNANVYYISQFLKVSVGWVMYLKACLELDEPLTRWFIQIAVHRCLHSFLSVFWKFKALSHGPLQRTAHSYWSL